MTSTKRRTIHGNGDVYEVDGLYHRANGPSICWDDGQWNWHLKGVRHRYYGPASSGGINPWIIHGDAVHIQ